MIYEEDAEEWALYLREVFSHAVKKETIMLYCLENFSLRHFESLKMNSYKCKLLILSNSLLTDLTPKKCQFLEKVLQSPGSVVTLLCGVKSSDQLYKLLNISGDRLEISTEQEPEDYISLIRSVLFKGSENSFEANIPTDLPGGHANEIGQGKETEELPGALEASKPLAVVLPSEVSCENPGEIFIILKDEVIGDTVEVEFISNNKSIRTRPALWNKTVWCMKALDFPAGSVRVNVYGDGTVKAEAEIKYYAMAKDMAFQTADTGYRTCQVCLLLVMVALYACRSWAISREPEEELMALRYDADSHFKELPTLLHCAAKFGLTNLATHLLHCSGASWASKMKNTEGSDPMHIAKMHGHRALQKAFEDFAILESSRNNEQEHEYEENVCSPTTQNAVFHPESWQTCKLDIERAEANKATEEEEAGNDSDQEDEQSPSEVGSEDSENQYDDLYVFMPGDEPEDNSQGPLLGNRPPLPPPRPVAAAPQLDIPQLTLPGTALQGPMLRHKNWCDPGGRPDTGSEPQEEEEGAEKEQEAEEDPYTFTEIDDNEYDTILANRSIKKKFGSRSFIINRPPAPTPRPTNIPPKQETTPYIAQVFQQKTARRQSDSDKPHGPPRKQDRARMESQAFSTLNCCLATGQEELILLQEKVKNGKLSVDEALEKFKHWQLTKSDLGIMQQEKLRQLRDCIFGKRPEEESAYEKLTIVHHPCKFLESTEGLGTKMKHTGPPHLASGWKPTFQFMGKHLPGAASSMDQISIVVRCNEVIQNENVSYSLPFSSKLPARTQVEKESGFFCKKEY
ncbi:B-cell scaffold protein with ankyrin repeats [Echinops telfairi]|uniref:B-cell scaffold protein with ankyrin repeats n=1 Tax=Echinops telfairi TaxID=9371 RepID=A0AC55CJ58_ECHTE|nr:B-cell scaffold protein with ankyrin repeats [Echinops telfairi]